MTYCYNCGHITSGEPLFCNFCGRSYDLKLCPRHHSNPRSAQACSQCGSRELSTPQPRVPLMWKLLAVVIRFGLGILLVYVSVCFLIAIVRTAEVQRGLVCLGLLLMGLWLVWSKLPDWLQDAVRSAMKSKRRSDGE